MIRLFVILNFRCLSGFSKIYLLSFLTLSLTVVLGVVVVTFDHLLPHTNEVT